MNHLSCDILVNRSAVLIVGNYALDSGLAALALWQDGEMIDVREYIHPDDSDLYLEYLSHINNAGVIVSSTSIGGVQLPVLLMPVPEANAAVVLLMAIPAARKRKRRGAPHAGG